MFTLSNFTVELKSIVYEENFTLFYILTISG
jgi:hypothetical protein